MIPFAHETVTLVRRSQTMNDQGKTVTTYSTHVLHRCSWRRVQRNTRYDNAIIHEESLVCRIPHTEQKPQVGDLLINGEVAVTVTSGADYNALVEKYRSSDGAMVVQTVQDNTRIGFPMKHWAVM